MEKIGKYALYLMLTLAAIVCICSIITAPSLELRLLAISVLVTIIVGGFINMWKIFHSSDNITVLSDRLDNLVKVREKGVNQARDIEEQRRKNRERPATEPLKKEFEKFLSYWEENKELIFEDVSHARKIPWMEIERVGKESKIIIGDNKNILSGSTENEITEIIDDLIKLSKLIRMNESFGPSDENYTARNQQALDEGDEIAKKIKTFIEKI